jgi:predicted permease
MSSGGTCTQSEAFSPTHFPTWAAVMIPVIAIATIVILWRCFRCMRRRPKQAHIESLGLLQPSSRVANTGDVGMSRQTVPDAAVHSTIADSSHDTSSDVIDARPTVAIEMEGTAAGTSNT